LHQTGVDEVSRCVGEAAGIELIRKRYTIDQNRNAISANATNVDALGPESRPGGLVVHSRYVAEYIGDRCRERVREIGS
jgi:hypothetical protein